LVVRAQPAEPAPRELAVGEPAGAEAAFGGGGNPVAQRVGGRLADDRRLPEGQAELALDAGNQLGRHREFRTVPAAGGQPRDLAFERGNAFVLGGEARVRRAGVRAAGVAPVQPLQPAGGGERAAQQPGQEFAGSGHAGKSPR